MIPYNPCLLVLHNICIVLSTVYQGWSVWPILYSTSNELWLSLPGQHNHYCLSLLSAALTLGKPTPVLWGHSSSQPYGMVHVARNWNQQATLAFGPCKWASLEVNSQMPAKSPMTATPADILIATSWKFWNHNHPTKLFLNSWWWEIPER